MCVWRDSCYNKELSTSTRYLYQMPVYVPAVNDTNCKMQYKKTPSIIQTVFNFLHACIIGACVNDTNYNFFFARVVFQFQPEQHCYIVKPVFMLVKILHICELVMEFKDEYSQSRYRTVDWQLTSIMKRQIVCMQQTIYSRC